MHPLPLDSPHNADNMQLCLLLTLALTLFKSFFNAPQSDELTVLLAGGVVFFKS